MLKLKQCKEIATTRTGYTITLLRVPRNTQQQQSTSLLEQLAHASNVAATKKPASTLVSSPLVSTPLTSFPLKSKFQLQLKPPQKRPSSSDLVEFRSQLKKFEIPVQDDYVPLDSSDLRDPDYADWDEANRTSESRGLCRI
ncbi:hypothetical protein G6F70_008658 [Rhizopus microsporus]|uniref:Uncharacterized protein n=1 Tax=Rhizopus microsporus TaxID=58291 RepID=A0A1X0RMF0_RHIZD|nr:hypothetical protein G6F71_005649 [Rhizopus microsporus]KAG1194887.1 hypothetical protein G6F70_008658 [Rhizopus microsporus]KAG1206708.1 hypothetical protein G6F69_008629 [Rhizopus microsporus]KAG1227177.1 hypothetical protein G6F67_008608 [Rhizopus microsporus]KAG1259023.1 hypothetical protein G6F68_008400 [Rhizopus microsporus]